MKQWVKWVSLSIWALIQFSCANIVPPSGGEKDTTPPRLLSMTPKDSLLNQRVSKIVLRFNKFIEINNLQKNMVLSPLLEIPPMVTVNGKTLTIKIADSLLKENTTYHISLGNAITDNREKTPYENFSFTFSTGPHFDSLSIKGQVVDVLTGNADTGISVQLYPESFNDSLLYVKKPLYATRTDASGNFAFNNLPQQRFKIYAIADTDDNKLFNRDLEKIGFLDSAVMAGVNDSSLVPLLIRVALMDKKVTASKDSGVSERVPYIGRQTNKAKNARQYAVMVDTTNKEKGAQDLTKPLGIRLNAVIQSIDTAKIFLSYVEKGGIEAEAQSHISSDSASLYVQHKWKGDTRYILRLIKGWATDTSGAELEPGRYEFLTKAESEYAKLQIQVPDSLLSERHLLLVKNGKDTVWFQPISSGVIDLERLNAGTAQMLIIVDENANGKWDGGDVFAKIHPEHIIHHERDVMLKAGWEHEESFAPKPIGSRASADQKARRAARE